MVSARIDRYTTVDDGAGGSYPTWTEHIPSLELATFDKLSGDEVLASEKLGRTSSHVAIIFEMVDIKSSDRMVIDGDIYNIKDVDNPNSLDRQLEITVEYTGERDV